MGFIDRWLETAIRQRMPASLGADHFCDMLGEVEPAYTRDSPRRIKDPFEGWMHVVGCTAINPDVTRAPCHITYVIQAEGVGIFSGDQVFELQSDQWPHPCDDLPVVFDRNRTENIQIQWDRLPTHAECLKQQINSCFCQPGNNDVASRLERLGALRATGVITADEFETHKHRILGDNHVAHNGRMTRT
jgi:hypothetical protein